MDEPERSIPQFKPYKRISRTPIYVLIIVIFLAFIIAVPIIYNSQIPEPETVVDTVTEEVTRTEVIVTGTPEHLNFTEYLDNPEQHHNEKVELKGFLIDELASDRAYEHYLLDSDKKKIKLTNIYGKNEEYFQKNIVSETPYLITGIFKRGYNEQPEIEVKKIITSKLSIINSSRNVTVTENLTKQITRTSEGRKPMPSILDLFG